MKHRLKNKSILITGASRGIGRTTTILAGEQGAKVAVNYFQNKSQAEDTVRKVKQSGGQALSVQADVSHPQAAKNLIQKTKAKFGSLDILINNAGITDAWVPLMDKDLSTWHRLIDVNFKGTINTTYAAIFIMKKQKTGGVIINISSGAGKTGYPNLAVYSATKFAVLGFTQAMDQELVKDNIRIYAVCPGMTATDMTGNQGMPPEKVARRILQAATEQLNLKPGEDTEIYS